MDTRLVEVGVVATDKANQPVLDLRKEDFTLKEDGIGQKIADLSVGRGQGRMPAIALPPGERVFQNRMTIPAGSLTVVLLDDLNTEPQDRANVQRQLVKSFSVVPQGHLVALYALGADLTLVRDFAVAGVPTHYPLVRDRFIVGGEAADSTSTQAETSNRKLDEVLNSTSDKLSDYRTVNRAERTLKAFEEIAARMKAIPGRKSLIWISGGFPLSIGLDGAVDLLHSRDSRSFGGDTERAARVLDDAQMALYPVDVRGVREAENAPIDRRVSSRTMARGGLSHDLAYDEMAYLADMTGGHSFHNSNDLSKAFLSAIEEGSASYSLGFYPDAAWDGRFHRLNVTVNRPGVKLRYRMGYFASEPSNSQPRSQDLEGAIKDAEDLKAIGLYVAVGIQDGGYKLTIAIDPRELKLTKVEENWIGALELRVISCAAEDRPKNSQGTKINIHLPQAQYVDALGNGLRLTTSVRVAPDSNQIRIGVRDQNSGAVGTLFLRTR